MNHRMISAVLAASTATLGCLGPMKSESLLTASLPKSVETTASKPAPARKPAPDDKPVARGKMPTTKLDDRSPVSAGDLTSANVREKLEAIKAELAEANRADDEPTGSSDQ